jgi:hypothetical protein
MTLNTGQSIEHWNTDCRCLTLDVDALCRAAEDVVGDATFCRDLATTHPHLLSAQPLFLSTAHADQMRAIIDAIERVVAMAPFQSAALERAPEIARFTPAPVGVFMGYDFHLGPDGPKLIEINTNAGGALINAYLMHAQRTCCMKMRVTPPVRRELSVQLTGFVEAFQAEWRLQGRSTPLTSIAIVDEAPTTQYLYPEFVLFQRLFEAHGLQAVIVAPEALAHRDGALWSGPNRIDLVYNRLTDFDFSAPTSRAIRAAYLAGDAVVTPNPHVHALFADKRNLTLLSDDDRLAAWGVDAQTRATLNAGIPRTIPVTRDAADALWAQRKGLFFKPMSGFGGKAAYRGDKVTKSVWADIVAGTPTAYVAQVIVPPSARTILVDGTVQSLKADLRNYTYAGSVQLVAARLYQGQTTNFRTPGGGFAPVFIGDELAMTRP